MELKERFVIAQAMIETYPDFKDFAVDAMAFLNFNLSPMQEDIADYMQNGPRLACVMAQRGEAKSTLAAMRAVWEFIHRPHARVLIVSAGESQANQVATLIIRMIMHWDILEYLRPDRSAGDKTSASDGFDIHHSLKGIEKSASVYCLGITANLQGNRADLLIPDDVESTKNGLTQGERAKLYELTKEFSSICRDGRILYLGTPQTKDSIYNSLPGRGYEVRIWPGRFPNQDEVERYGTKLAPYILEKLKENPFLGTGKGIDGTRGYPTDPVLFNDAQLIEKETDQGPESFQLQYMLDTTLSDALRQQLKLSDLIVANFDWKAVPEMIPYRAAPEYLYRVPDSFPVPSARLYQAASTNCQYTKLTDLLMFIDPAGSGSDELAVSLTGATGAYIHLLRCIGLKGGSTDDNLDKICDILEQFECNYIQYESNMGSDMFGKVLMGYFQKKIQEGRTFFKNITIEPKFSTGQKERRIINNMVSALQRHQLVIHPMVFEDDVICGRQHSTEKRASYSLFYQMTNITTDKNSLQHEDRLEAAAAGVGFHKNRLTETAESASIKRKQEELENFAKNPMGYSDNVMNQGKGAFGSKKKIYSKLKQWR